MNSTRWTCVCARALIALVVALSGVRADDVFYVTRDSEWRFLPGTEEASSPDTAAWRQIDFEDSAWEEAHAPLGYGNPPYGTDLSEREPPMRRNYSSVYLRRAFSLEEPERIAALYVNVDYDDGFMVWLNGTEVLRVNLPGESGEHLPPDETASRSHESGEFARFELPEAEQLLVTGRNVLAVHAFNVTASSNDMKIDVELLDPFGPDLVPPDVATVTPPAGLTTRSLSLIEVEFDEAVTGVDAADLLVGGRAADVVQGAGAGPYLFEFTEPPEGPVEIRWSPDHGIFDVAETPNPFGGGQWTYTLDPNVAVPRVRISEFVAANGSGIRDEFGDTPDWIEIQNEGDTPVDLSGWALTDDPGDPNRWTFPSTPLGAGDYLIVFASGRDERPSPRGELHTNFKINRSGDDLILSTPELPRRVASDFADFPEQRRDHSYGFTPDGTVGYLETPTPGELNDEEVLESFVRDPEFSVEHGLFGEAFPLELSVSTQGAQIWFTLDGSVPTPEDGTRYDGPIMIDGSEDRAVQTVRAAAYRDGFLPSEVITRTYIFPGMVSVQPDLPEGFPTRWGTAPRVDYEMDPEVTQDPENAGLVEQGLRTLPIVSIVGDIEDMFGRTGLYSNSTREGIASEREGSAELIYPPGLTAPDGSTEGFQINCGVRMHGGASRNPDRSAKHSWRLLFKGAYGPTKLRHPLFPDSDVDSFDTVIMRANYNNSWIHWDSGQRRRGTMIRDQWVRDGLRDMGQVTSHGRQVSLFVNGLFWGVYNLVERPSASFAAEHMGGNKEEWDALNSAQPIDGDGAAWSRLMALAGANLREDAAYQALLAMLDRDNFIDYMIANFFGSNGDWPSHNWYAARRRVDAATFKFFSWDAERIFEGVNDNRTGVSDGNSPGFIWSRVRQNPEFRLNFADRVHRHYFNGGALATETAQARWDDRANEVEKAVVLEAARWGDYRRDVHPSSNGPYEFYRYRTHWLPEQKRLRDTYFPRRTARSLAQFVQIGVYPRVEAPVFSQHGGEIAAGFRLAMNLPEGQDGTIYYTTDGSDPRVAFTGELSPSATAYSGAVPLDDFSIVKSRNLHEDSWSALNEATFTLAGATAHGVVISEIHYNPGAAGPDALASEFIELHNPGDTTIDLEGTMFSNGIDYRFTAGDALAPGAYLVLAADDVGFAARYPDVPLAGTYKGNLSGSGEKITLRTPEGEVLFSVDYDDEGFWPIGPDGFGYSLVLEDPDVDPDDPRAWRASSAPGGSPGDTDPQPAHDGAVINELLIDEVGGAGGIELHNITDSSLDIGHWFLSPSRADVASLAAFAIEEGTEIPASGYVVIDPRQLPFEIDRRGGELYLAAADSVGELTGYIAGVEFRAADEGVAFGRHETSTGLEFSAMSRATLGSDNSPPRSPEIAINEIHYHPADGGDEFLELFNPAGTPRSVDGWKITGISDAFGADSYRVPDGTSVPAAGFLLVVPIEPEAFRATHDVPDSAIVVGPFGGGLDNSGERLRLLKPLVGEDDVFVEVDMVRFNDREPWPTEADGEGSSLERVRWADFGNEVLSWAASEPGGGTPGALNSVSEPVEPPAGGSQLPGDINQDSRLNITDAVSVLSVLFGGAPTTLPCGEELTDSGNSTLLDASGDGSVNITDAVQLLTYLFQNGPPHVLGTSCVVIEGCGDVCE